MLRHKQASEPDLSAVCMYVLVLIGVLYFGDKVLDAARAGRFPHQQQHKEASR